MTYESTWLLNFLDWPEKHTKMILTKMSKYADLSGVIAATFAHGGVCLQS